MMHRPSLLVFAAPLLAALAPSARAEPPLLEVSHQGAVYVVAWSPDGKTLASAGQDGTVILTDVAARKELRRFRAQASIKGLAFAPDGKSLAVKGDGDSLSLYDAATGKMLKTLGPGLQMYTGTQLAFSADGSSVTAVGPGERLTWMHTRGGASGSKTAPVPAGSSAAVAPDGSRTAWGYPSGQVQLADANGLNYQQIQVGPAQSLAFAPGGKQLASGNADKVVRLWDAGAGRELRRFEGLGAVPWRLAFSADGRLLAALASGGQSVRVWDVERARVRRQLTGLRSPVTALALSPDGKTLATAGDDGKARLWNLAVRDLVRPDRPVALPAKELTALWDDLGSDNHARADAAFRKLAGAGETAVPFLREQLRGVAMPPVDGARLDQHVRDLSSPVYAVRNRAFAALLKQGELAEPRLRKLLAARPSLEAERRANQLLAKLQEPDLSPDRVRALEVIELLEWLHTPEARRALQEVARDGLIRRLRGEAAEALRRLEAQPAATGEKR
jgi:hypothetical protein